MIKAGKITVVVPTYDGFYNLRECIESLLKQSLTPYEVIIIDNASREGIHQIIQSIKSKNKNCKARLKVFRNSKNLGVTGGRNRGIKEANKYSDYIFFFDHDMVADENMLEELVKVSKNSRDIGIVTPKIYYWDKKDIIWSAGTGINLWTGQIIFRGGEDEGQYDSIEEVEVAPAAILVKKEVIDQIKKFDDRYFATYEDTDFCFRAKEKGYSTYYVPKAIAYHKIPYNIKESEKRLLDRTYWIARNRIIFMRRFGKNFLLFLIILPIFFAYYTYFSLVYIKPKAIAEYIRGTFSGLKTG